MYLINCVKHNVINGTNDPARLIEQAMDTLFDPFISKILKHVQNKHNSFTDRIQLPFRNFNFVETIYCENDKIVDK